MNDISSELCSVKLQRSLYGLKQSGRMWYNPGLNNIISGLSSSERKLQSDYESSAWSPTSPLDFRLFSTLGNPFGVSSSSSISVRKSHRKSWDSDKVGLSIVDSLDVHHHHHHHNDNNTSRLVLPSPDSTKNIIFGSSMRTRNPKCNPMVEYFSVLSQPLTKTTMHKPNVDLIELETDSSCSVNGYGNNNDGCYVMKKSEIEISEDYTCVISHVPNPKTTHFYGDRVLESLEVECLKKGCCGNKKESIFVIAPLDLTTTSDVLPNDDFLSFCYLCNKKLDMGEDIYMYRGYKAFCSSECRAEVIHEEEEMEEEEDEAAKPGCSSSDNGLTKKKSSNGVMFTVG
ncbi:unnamed protein product [Cochlearia groenlandica]